MASPAVPQSVIWTEPTPAKYATASISIAVIHITESIISSVSHQEYGMGEHEKVISANDADKVVHASKEQLRSYATDQ